jgi:hypothetical protein
MPTSTIPRPAEFLAVEIGETSRLTRELTAAAGNAIATLAECAPNGPKRQALHRLMVALQAQDRVEQRLVRLEAFARALDGHLASQGAPAALRDSLQLDELLAALDRHMAKSRGCGEGEGLPAMGRPNGNEIEMFD